jgi:hypothetical protein
MNSNINKSSKSESVFVMDEFGRDISLRKPKVSTNLNWSEDNARLFREKSWAEISWEEDEKEEEEEEERKREEERAREEEEKKIKKEEYVLTSSINAIHDYWRKIHWQIGEYELEEGEIFE